jgi:hypothetical protein
MAFSSEKSPTFPPPLTCVCAVDIFQSRIYHPLYLVAFGILDAYDTTTPHDRWCLGWSSPSLCITIRTEPNPLQPTKQPPQHIPEKRLAAWSKPLFRLWPSGRSEIYP